MTTENFSPTFIHIKTSEEAKPEGLCFTPKKFLASSSEQPHKNQAQISPEPGNLKLTFTEHRGWWKMGTCATGVYLGARKVFTKGRHTYYCQTSFAATKLKYQANLEWPWISSRRRNKTSRPHEKSNVSAECKVYSWGQNIHSSSNCCWNSSPERNNAGFWPRSHSLCILKATCAAVGTQTKVTSKHLLTHWLTTTTISLPTKESFSNSAPTRAQKPHAKLQHLHSTKARRTE